MKQSRSSERVMSPGISLNSLAPLQPQPPTTSAPRYHRTPCHTSGGKTFSVSVSKSMSRGPNTRRDDARSSTSEFWGIRKTSAWRNVVQLNLIDAVFPDVQTVFVCFTRFHGLHCQFLALYERLSVPAESQGRMGGCWGVDPLIIPQLLMNKHPAKQFISLIYDIWLIWWIIPSITMVLRSEPMFSHVLPPTVSKFESLSNPPTATCSPAFTIKARSRDWTSCANFQIRYRYVMCVLFVALLSVVEKKWFWGRVDFGWFGADMVIPCNNILSAYWYYHHVQNRRNKDHGTLWTLFQRDFHQHVGATDRTSDSIIPTTKGSTFTSCKWWEAETSLVIGGIK